MKTKKNLGYGMWVTYGEKLKNPGALYEMNFGMRDGDPEGWVPDFTYPVKHVGEANRIADGLAMAVKEAKSAKLTKMGADDQDWLKEAVNYRLLATAVLEESWPGVPTREVKWSSYVSLLARPDLFEPIKDALFVDFEGAELFWHPKRGRLWVVTAEAGCRPAFTVEENALNKVFEDLGEHLVLIRMRDE